MFGSIRRLRGGAQLKLVDSAAPEQPQAGGTLRVDVGHATQQGRRSRNEDFVGAAMPEGADLENKGMMLVVADGVGGHANGREAAEHSVRSLLADYYATPDTWRIARSLDTVLSATNRWLLAQARKARDYAGMATTLTAFVLRGSRWHLAHVGDSRAYLLRDGQLLQLSEDHTWEHPELSNVLRRAIGLDQHLVVDHSDSELQLGDRFLLLTDGVWGTLGDQGIKQIALRHPDSQEAADALALDAIRGGSNDNCTALVARVLALPEGNLRDSVATARKLPLPPRLKPGQVLDGLTIQELLHESRLILLYRVTRPGSAGSPPETLVMKTLRPEADDPEAIAALAHEEWLARRTVARCFPQVATHAARAHLYYLMSWHEGQTLKQTLGRGHRFAPHEVAEMGIRLLKGVGQLHRLGIVHRDIKPDNLHLDSSSQLRILDLGVAASDGQDFKEINNPGTPSYMAPELFDGAYASEQTDLYGCGVTLYELLTRKYPYGEIEAFQKPRFGSITPVTRYRPDVPGWLEAIILKACARDPKDRFETAEEFVLALERGAHRPLTSPRRLPLVQRNPSKALKVVAVVSLLVNLVLVYLLLGR